MYVYGSWADFAALQYTKHIKGGLWNDFNFKPVLIKLHVYKIIHGDIVSLTHFVVNLLVELPPNLMLLYDYHCSFFSRYHRTWNFCKQINSYYNHTIQLPMYMYVYVTSMTYVHLFILQYVSPLLFETLEICKLHEIAYEKLHIKWYKLY